MGEPIPPEAKRAIDEFNAQQAAERRAREKSPDDRRREFQIKRITTGEAERLARRYQIMVETGGGRHGKHLVAPDQTRCSLPDHGGGVLATGTARNIIKFIRDHGRGV